MFNSCAYKTGGVSPNKTMGLMSLYNHRKSIPKSRNYTQLFKENDKEIVMKKKKQQHPKN